MLVVKRVKSIYIRIHLVSRETLYWHFLNFIMYFWTFSLKQQHHTVGSAIKDRQQEKEKDYRAKTWGFFCTMKPRCRAQWSVSSIMCSYTIIEKKRIFFSEKIDPKKFSGWNISQLCGKSLLVTWKDVSLICCLNISAGFPKTKKEGGIAAKI